MSLKRILPVLAVLLSIGWLSGGVVRAATEEVAVVKTPLGEIVWRFFPDAAPGHVAYVKELIAAGFYDGTTFHRVIPHFVVQGGDPNSKNADRADDGEGEADRRVDAEFSTALHYRPGTVGMARDTDPNSGSCQYFIALDDIPRLDGNYTIFGEVVAGLDIARRIAALPRDLNDNPLEKVPVTVRLDTREVSAPILSQQPASRSGEILTGPDKPKAFDPKDAKWQAPRLMKGTTAALPHARLELVVGIEGDVLDVRFPALDTPEPARVLEAARTWRFEPARYDGSPQKVRIAIDTDGTAIAAPR